MSKSLKVLALLAIAFVSVSGETPGQRGKQTQESAPHKTTASDIDATPKIQAHSASGITHKDEGNKEQHPPAKKPSYWEEAFGPAYAANWTVVIVALVASFVAWLTLRRIGDQTDAIKRQVKVMEDQMALMQVPFINYLDLRDWDAVIDLTPPGRLWIRAQLVNPTQYLITVNSGRVFFEDAGRGSVMWSVCDGRVIARERQLGVEVCVYLTNEQITNYTEGCVTIPVRGDISHTGVLGPEMKRYLIFRGRVDCGKHRATVYFPELEVTKTEKEYREYRTQQDQLAN